MAIDYKARAKVMMRTVAKLPLTADGVRMYPGMRVWCYDLLSFYGDPKGTIRSDKVGMLDADGWWYDDGVFVPCEACYSSRAAAISAGKPK